MAKYSARGGCNELLVSHTTPKLQEHHFEKGGERISTTLTATRLARLEGRARRATESNSTRHPVLRINSTRHNCRMSARIPNVSTRVVPKQITLPETGSCFDTTVVNSKVSCGTATSLVR